jgi:hypothetical protein
MSWHAHKTKTDRKIITIQEWADYIGVSRQTLTSYLDAYQKAHVYDSHDIISILNFLKYLLIERLAR